MIKCTFENGKDADLRHVVVDSLIIKDNKILLIKRGPHLLNPNKYALPGGYVDRDETTKQTAVREAFEETGYNVEVEKLFTIIDSPDRPQEDRQNIAFVYVVHPIDQTGKPDHEVTEVAWFDLDKLPDEKEFAFDHYQVIENYKNSLA